ncbi:MAG: nitrite reductase [Nocardioidaceae bacterium]|nr:nitrite reductase [Nocardioidaceae bacterium]
MAATRTRADRCPGALRPWPAPDGLLVRIRLIGGRVPLASLRALITVAEEYADGRIRLTSRANLQVRAFARRGAALAPEALAALEATGLLPSRTHELVRNVMATPGFDGAMLDALDRALCADPVLAGLPGRFLLVLDDGRGHLLDRPCDLGVVLLGDDEAQLRIGDRWGPVVVRAEVADRLVGLARDFVAARGSGAAAAWHVTELPGWGRVPESPGYGGLRHTTPDPRLPAPSGPLPFGPVPGGRHVAVSADGLDRAAVEELSAGADHLVVTPWHGVLVPEEDR